MGTISEIAYGFPAYDGVIPQSTATIAQILRMNGYSTAMFGKAHFTPMSGVTSTDRPPERADDPSRPGRGRSTATA